MPIEVKNLTKAYGQQKAIDNISFSVSKGEIVGFLGPNGAGKSTTLKIITGYLQADAGSATVEGIDVTSEPIAVKSKVGYLPEANPLYFDMYVREYLEFIAGVHHVPDVKPRINNIIALTGLTLEAGKKIGQLSKGYKQRVGLAAALIHDPEVIILDEPTSGLDPNQIIEIREVIKNLGQNKTVIFSSHILQEVEAICDRVIIINKGKIVADDTLSNLTASEAGKQVVIVEFSKAPGVEILSDLSSVHNVQQQGAQFYLATQSPDQLKKEILQLSVQHGLDIVSLRTESVRLEEIFRQLTS
jgi:ABC-2 type transport system ATP-binding protein